MIEFTIAHCPECRAVVGDGLSFRGLFRTLCPGCGRRVWLMGDGETIRPTRVDRKPKRLPTAKGAKLAAVS
jgi:hypothetical protein